MRLCELREPFVRGTALFARPLSRAQDEIRFRPGGSIHGKRGAGRAAQAGSRRVGLQAEDFGAHSLRAGFVTVASAQRMTLERRSNREENGGSGPLGRRLYTLCRLWELSQSEPHAHFPLRQAS